MCLGVYLVHMEAALTYLQVKHICELNVSGSRFDVLGIEFDVSGCKFDASGSRFNVFETADLIYQ